MQDIQLRYNDYIGRFYRRNKRGRWYKFDQIGNTDVAMDVAKMLTKLGHKVEYVNERQEDDL